MAANIEEIVNKSLQKLGARPIVSLGEDSPNARSATAAYNITRQSLLREYNWNFAIVRASVTVDATQTVFGNLNRYALPAGFLRLLRNRETSWRAGDERKDWQIEGKFIVTSYGTPLEFRYIKDVTTVTEFDAMFTELLSVRLAKAMCQDITGSLDRGAELDREAKEIVRMAREMNSFENEPILPAEDDWVLARL